METSAIKELGHSKFCLFLEQQDWLKQHKKKWKSRVFLKPLYYKGEKEIKFLIAV